MSNLICVRVSAVMLLAAAPLFASGELEPCRSPSGAVEIEFALQEGVPLYRVRYADADAIGWSELGVDLAGGERLGRNCQIVSVGSTEIDEAFDQFPGKRRHVRGACRETTLRLREVGAPHREWEVVLRAYDNGAALRYRFPQQQGWNDLVIAAERTQFVLPAEATAHALPLAGHTTSFEGRYQTLAMKDLNREWLYGLPLLVELSADRWLAITEADLDEYSGMMLPANETPTLTAELAPLPDEPGVAVRARLPHASPWRVVMLAPSVAGLIESDLVLQLNKPCAIADTSWIHPGKTTFPWWNGFVLDGVDFEPGLNTATTKHYIDFCAAHGIEHHSLDGIDNLAWYGGPIVPYEGADPAVALPAIDLPEVIGYARSKGVGLRLWMHWGAAQKHMERAFPQYRAWGIEGVMLDFIDRDDQLCHRFLRRAIALAADNHLTVTLHGCPKPTGLERTYPNLLTHEGVLNLEYNKWEAEGCPPEHQIMVACTRMLAGPLDFHQGSFRAVPVDQFHPQDRAPLVMGTPCRTLAGYVVLQNHLPMVADSPSAYTDLPALGALAKIPTSWDDTRVLHAEVGRCIAIARRAGDAWHIGAMTDRTPRTLELPLDILEGGPYAAQVWTDGAAPPHAIEQTERRFSAGQTLSLDLAPAGGAYVKLTPLR